MPFWPDNGYAYSYLIALCLLMAFVLRSKRNDVLYSAVLLSCLWLLTRAIRVFDADNFILWLATDFFTIGGFIIIGTRQAMACAILYFVSMLFDSVTLIWGGSFEGAAAVNEAVGYISMLIIAGAAYDWNLMGRTALWGRRVGRHIDTMVHRSQWSPFARRSERIAPDMEDVQNNPYADNSRGLKTKEIDWGKPEGKEVW